MSGKDLLASLPDPLVKYNLCFIEDAHQNLTPCHAIRNWVSLFETGSCISSILWNPTQKKLKALWKETAFSILCKIEKKECNDDEVEGIEKQKKRRKDYIDDEEEELECIQEQKEEEREDRRL